MKLVYIIYKNSVLTSKKTQHFSIIKINWLMLLKEIITVYSKNHKKPIHTFCGQNAELLNVKAHGTYTYHRALEGLIST
jgi:uracil DNA glycosylase